MQKLLYATTNSGKVLSLRKHLQPHGFDIEWASIAIPEPRFDSVQRTAQFKAMYAFQELKRPVVTNDSGFFIRDLNGFPGTFVNFALNTININGLLRLADGTDRVCEFRHALAYDDGLDGVEVFCDVVPGSIAPEPRGAFNASYHWSPLATIFIPAGQEKTLGQMSLIEYFHWSEQMAPKPRYYELFAAWYKRKRLIKT